MSRRNSSNLHGLDYREEAKAFRRLPYPIVDVHSHINGDEAVKLYVEAARLYGVEKTFSMTLLEQAPRVLELMGDSLELISMPTWAGDPLYEHGEGYANRIERFHKLGARIAKFWSAPRILDFSSEPYHRHPLRLNSPQRKVAMKVASQLGMKFMVHVADPDTWFASRYTDQHRYGSKRAQYDALEEVLLEFGTKTIAAHMGGWPEDLNFLSRLLERNPNLYLDTSATKWIVRELSKHPPTITRDFFVRWQGRLLFGSDIVSYEDHLTSATGSNEMQRKASSREEAFDLYASRYWALRTLFESSYSGPSPIADPDLAMVDPERFRPMDSPMLQGIQLPPEVLKSVYHDTIQEYLQ